MTRVKGNPRHVSGKGGSTNGKGVSESNHSPRITAQAGLATQALSSLGANRESIEFSEDNRLVLFFVLVFDFIPAEK